MNLMVPKQGGPKLPILKETGGESRTGDIQLYKIENLDSQTELRVNMLEKLYKSSLF